MSGAVEVLGAALVLLGSLFFLLSAVGVLRSGDAVSRVNNLSPAMGVGLPLIILGAALVRAADGDLTVGDALMALVAIGGSLVVSSVASNLLGRAAYRAQDALDPRTLGDALAGTQDGPGSDPAADRGRADEGRAE